MKTSIRSYLRGGENQELIWSELESSKERAKSLAECWRRQGKRQGLKLTVRWDIREVKFAGRAFEVFPVVAYVQHQSVPCSVCEWPVTWMAREVGTHRCKPKRDPAFDVKVQGEFVPQSGAEMAAKKLADMRVLDEAPGAGAAFNKLARDLGFPT